MITDPLQSFSCWATRQALEFRNPPHDVGIDDGTEDGNTIPAPARSTCEQVVRIVLIEFLDIPLLIVASLVEGVVRTLIGFIVAATVFLGGQALEKGCGIEETECCDEIMVLAISHGITGGIDTLTNVATLVKFARFNITDYNKELWPPDIEWKSDIEVES